GHHPGPALADAAFRGLKRKEEGGFLQIHYLRPFLAYGNTFLITGIISIRVGGNPGRKINEKG
ncbi:MAG: hypothetical protein AB1585_14415, partial [Thermodesulfobacteriota bacterium]